WIAHLMWSYVLRRGQGAVSSNDTGLLVERDPDTVRGPDIVVFDESKKIEELSRKFSERIPRLIIEVFSPSDKWSKMLRRIQQFFQRGVPLVWVVDPEANEVTVHRPGQEPTVARETDELSADEVLPNCRFKVAEFFTLPGKEGHTPAGNMGASSPD